jgi:hypothetical protein
MADTPTSEHGADGAIPFLTLWYRFLFFGCSPT